jgi:hypothetical protein
MMEGLGADSEEKHEPAGDIDTAAVDSLKALDPKRPIREADIVLLFDHLVGALLKKRRHIEAKRFSRLEVYHKLELCWQFDR